MQQRATMIEDVECRVSPGLTDYAAALVAMEARAAAIAAGEARELVWLLEHPPVYTAGPSADPRELVDPRFPVVPAGRGGRYTIMGRGSASATSCSISTGAAATCGASFTRWRAG